VLAGEQVDEDGSYQSNEDQVNAISESEIDWSRYVSSFRTWAWSLLRLFSLPSRPLIIILDDIQWQEPAEAELWVSLLQHPSRHLVNAMVCVTYRTDVQPVLTFSNPMMLEVQPLSPTSIKKLLAR
jgi:predicted ATPase